MTNTQGEKVVVAEFGAPHGVRGLVKIRTFTEHREAIFGFGALEDDAGTAYQLSYKGQTKVGVIAAVDGIDDRDSAERLRGKRLLVARAALPAPEEEEYYHADLIGLAVFLDDGSRYGTVRAVHDFASGDMLEVDPIAGRRTTLIPFKRDFVPEVDIANGRLVVAPIDGLLDAPSGGGEEP